jgi:hypothetical protein
MKNLFRIGLMLSIVAVLGSCENIARKSNDPFVVHVDSSVQFAPYHFAIDTKAVETINAMAKEVQRVDSVQFGVCDTCTTGFKAAILENQLLAERLARESHTLREKLQLLNETIMTTNQLIDHTDQKSKELAALKRKLADEIEIQVAELKNSKQPQMYVKK